MMYKYLLGLVLLAGCASQDHLEKKPVWILSLNGHMLTTVNGVTYIPPELWEEFTTPPLSIDDQAILEHEHVHAHRQRHSITWLLDYIFNKSFRWQEERIAEEVRVAYLKKHNRTMRVETLVSWATDPGYYGMVTEEEARKWAIDVLK